MTSTCYCPTSGGKRRNYNTDKHTNSPQITIIYLQNYNLIPAEAFVDPTLHNYAKEMDMGLSLTG